MGYSFALVLRLVWLLVLSACGRIGFEPTASPSDAAIDARVGSGPFATPTPVTELNSTMLDGDATLRGDLLEIVFTSNRPGGAGAQDLWTSRRATRTSPWDPPIPLSALNTGVVDEAAEISRDGLELFFTSNRPPSDSAGDVWMATRATVDDAWGTPVRVPELSSGVADFVCALTGDGLKLYLDSSRGGTFDNFAATRPTLSTPWSPPLPVTELNTSARESASSVAPDDRTLFFTSDRAGATGADDLWVTTRGESTDPFGTPANLRELNSTSDDTDPWISPDLTVLHFSSFRTGAGDLYSASR